MTDLNKKFSRIAEKHKKIDLHKVDDVYETIDTLSKQKKATNTNIANKLKFKRNTVTRIVALLKKYAYAALAEGGNGIPFLAIIESDNSERSPLFGKEKIGKFVEENFEELKENLSKIPGFYKEKNEILSYKSKDKNGSFFNKFNYLVEQLWKIDKTIEIFKIQIRSMANRYVIRK
ncbi:MAG TPA: hypothetical protein VJB94_00420 [Candidatus Nanoarchaeia archaeon]|nr:hypothetical protein [Candidatus Nanoarchaeia archaeon]